MEWIYAVRKLWHFINAHEGAKVADIFNQSGREIISLAAGAGIIGTIGSISLK